MIRDLEGAKNDLTTALEYNKDEFRIYDVRGMVNLELKEYEEAIEDFTNSLNLLQSSISYYYRGLAYYELKDFDNAIKDFTKSIELDPDDLKVYQNRGDAYCNLGNYDEAIKDFAVVSELEKNLK